LQPTGVVGDGNASSWNTSAMVWKGNWQALAGGAVVKCTEH